jgi:hypothetical protein
VSGKTRPVTAPFVAVVFLVDVGDTELPVELDFHDGSIWRQDVDFDRSVALALDAAHRACARDGACGLDRPCA